MRIWHVWPVEPRGVGRAMPRVLVVEDNIDIGWLLCHALRTAGWTTDFAHRGDLALDRLARPPLPDLVVLDYRMPKLTGEDVLRAIRVHPQVSGLPVVLCSAEGPRDLPADVRAMVSAVIDKPFTIAEVVAAAGAAIEPREADRTA
jgi:two-component system, response regulator, stage 0 sporulation protein F